MTKGQGRCRIIAIAAGEVKINLLEGQRKIEASFRLVTEESLSVGKMTKEGGWSERTSKALSDFLLSLEADAVYNAFDEKAPDSPAAEEPRQA